MYSQMLPKALRQLIRNNQYTHNTSGCCTGYIQANVILLHKSVANQFLTFLEANKVPCPILYYSQPGEFTAAPITTEPSCIITDLPSYEVIKHGVVMETVNDLKNFSDILHDYQTFYIGCSFSFERALASNKIPLRNIEQNCNVSMYNTNIKTNPTHPFNTNLIVSMRPIPKHLLLRTFEITSSFEDAHGVPIHVGDPNTIGICNIHKPDYGDVVTFHPGDIPVFWGCGLTSSQAVRQANLDLVFSHNPGHMFISDMVDNRELTGKCEQYYLRDMPNNQVVTFLGHSVATKIRTLEDYIIEDVNNRGIRHLQVENDFIKACLVLSHSSTIALVSEFPCFAGDDIPFETDGIPGILALAKLLLKLNKKVYLLTNHKKMRPILEKCVLTFDWLQNPNLHVCNTDQVRATINSTIDTPGVTINSTMDTAGITINSTIDTAGITINNTDTPGVSINSKANFSTVFDCILTLEHAGPAADTRYYTMNGRDITEHCSLIDNQIASLSQKDRYGQL